MRKARMLSAVVALTLGAGTSSPAWAQAPSVARVEAFGSAGLGPMWDDESALGTGGVFGAGIGYRLFPRFSVEFLVGYRKHNRDFESGVRFGADAWAPTGRAAYYLSDRAFQPYVGGSVGRDRVTRRSEFPDDCEIDGMGRYTCQTVQRTQRAVVARSLAAFSGVRLAVDEHSFVRPEVEIRFAGEFVMIGGSVALGWSW
jgi:hypothetical protein